MTTRKTHSHVTLAAAMTSLAGGPRFLFDKDDPAAPPADPFTAMREEFSRLHSEATAIVEAAATENRELKPDEKMANEQRFARMNTIKATLDERARFASLALADDPDGKGGKVQTPREPSGREDFNRSEGKGRIDVIDKDNRAEFNKALSGWAMTGQMDRKFATITTATESSALLPRIIGEPIIPMSANVFREAYAIHGLTPVQTRTTAAMNIPVMTASAGGAVAEDASSATENAPALSGTIPINATPYQSGVAWFSNTVLNANDFDLVTYIQTDLTYAKELGLESTIVAAMIADAGITQEVATATTTGFTYANLVDLNRKLPKRYDRLKVIILSAAAFSAAEKLVGDTDGQPILNRDPQNQSLLRFNGTPVLRSDYLEALTAGKVVGLVASMIGFRLRDVTQQDLERYRESGKPNQTGFNLVAHHGYGYDVAAVAKLKTPAS